MCSLSLFVISLQWLMVSLVSKRRTVSFFSKGAVHQYVPKSISMDLQMHNRDIFFYKALTNPLQPLHASSASIESSNSTKHIPLRRFV